MFLIYLAIGIIVATAAIVGIIFFIQNNKIKKLNAKNEYDISRFSGASLNSIKMYKDREVDALNGIRNMFPNYKKEKLYEDIDEIVRRLLNAQNNGYISAVAFQKSGQDKVLYEVRNMTKLDTIIIGYENNYASVAVIFESSDKKLYQLLLRLNVLNEMIYLDSYNAMLWFNN